MVKKHSQGLLILLAAMDALASGGAWLLAWWLRTEGARFLPGQRGEPEFELYLQVLPVVAAAAVAANRLAGAYRPRRGRRVASEFALAAKGTAYTLVALAAASFLQREYEFSRWIAVFFGASNVAVQGLCRALFWKVSDALRAKGVNVSRALIVGSGRLGGHVLESVRRNPWAGIQAVGFVDSRPERAGRTIHGTPVVGTPDGISAAIRETRADLVFIALPAEEHAAADRLLDALSEETVDVRVVPDFAGSFTLNAEVSEFDGLPVLSLRESPLYGWNRFQKRALDLAFSGAVLLLLSPLYLLLALLVKLTSPGPVFYRQERMGLDGRTFDMLKFRSMRADAEKSTGAVWAKENDPRRTRFGTFLRKTSLDEIPQFINVFLGHMSVVGPRPERPVFIEQFKKTVPRYMLRHKMKAGITGWAQVNGWRGNTSLRKRIQYDLYYIEHWSLSFDLRIIALTVIRGMVAKNAY
ncbi:MAG: undecaprenyl-phosphate glucose phosphotransferase [Planctomycetes bacterium]|jgi:Undecaprenyl-phosphate glucose phosphotransferase|nr:undecaprenyl-phosphate glucose phosphotransferase [Planctomycetota bacterium]